MALFSTAAKSNHYRLLRLESNWKSPVPWWCLLCLTLTMGADHIAWLQPRCVATRGLNFAPPHELSAWRGCRWGIPGGGQWGGWFGKTSFKLQPPRVLLEPYYSCSKAEGGQDPSSQCSPKNRGSFSQSAVCQYAYRTEVFYCILHKYGCLSQDSTPCSQINSYLYI